MISSRIKALVPQRLMIIIETGDTQRNLASTALPAGLPDLGRLAARRSCLLSLLAVQAATKLLSIFRNLQYEMQIGWFRLLSVGSMVDAEPFEATVQLLVKRQSLGKNFAVRFTAILEDDFSRQ